MEQVVGEEEPANIVPSRLFTVQLAVAGGANAGVVAERRGRPCCCWASKTLDQNNEDHPTCGGMAPHNRQQATSSSSRANVGEEWKSRAGLLLFNRHYEPSQAHFPLAALGNPWLKVGSSYPSER